METQLATPYQQPHVSQFFVVFDFCFQFQGGLYYKYRVTPETKVHQILYVDISVVDAKAGGQVWYGRKLRGTFVDVIKYSRPVIVPPLQ